MRSLLLIARLLVGSTFIVSGLVKANDPLGFAYKLDEYFAVSALGLPGLMPWSLTLAILACLAEVVLGFAVLVGGRMKLATTALLVLTLFFGWLTAFTGRCNDLADAGTPMTYTAMVDGQPEQRERTCVNDCGCFGDAMRGSVGRSLTPWESFAKDAILFVFILPLFITAWRRGIPWNRTADDLVYLPFGLALVAVWSWVFTWWGPLWITALGMAGYLLIKRLLKGPAAEWTTAAWTALVGFGLAWYALEHLPPRDYRPFHTGSDITAKRTGTPAKQAIFMTYLDKRTNEEKEYDISGPYPWEDEENFEYVRRRVQVIEPGVDAPIPDFILNDVDGNDITDDLLAEERPVLLLMMYDVTTSRTGAMPRIKALVEEAQRNGWVVYGVTRSNFIEAAELKHTHQLPIDFVRCDEKTIKMAVRANPGLLLLRTGVVMGKWHGNDTPTFEEAKGRL